MKVIEGSHINYLFQQACFHMSEAKIVEVGYANFAGNRTKEIHPCTLTLNDATARTLIYPKRGNNPYIILAETMWVLAGRNDMAFLSKFMPRAIEFSDDGKIWRAAYGKRLFDLDGIDQIKFCLSQLKKNILSRQAVATLWIPQIETKVEKTKDWPCSNYLHFLVREGKLDCLLAMRSNDMMWGWSQTNAYEFTVIQELLARCLNVPVGKYFHVADSFHLYEKDWKKAEDLIEVAHYTNTILNLPKFKFCDPQMYAEDPMNEYEMYIGSVKSLCDNVNDEPVDVYHYMDLCHIHRYLNLFLEQCQEFDGSEKFDKYKEKYNSVMKNLPMTDLKLSCHYWSMKNTFEYKEDSDSTLLKNCFEDIVNNKYFGQ